MYFNAVRNDFGGISLHGSARKRTNEFTERRGTSQKNTKVSCFRVRFTNLDLRRSSSISVHMSGSTEALFACTKCNSRHPFDELSQGQQLCKVTYASASVSERHGHRDAIASAVQSWQWPCSAMGVLCTVHETWVNGNHGTATAHCTALAASTELSWCGCSSMIEMMHALHRQCQCIVCTGKTAKIKPSFIMQATDKVQFKLHISALVHFRTGCVKFNLMIRNGKEIVKG